MRLVSLASAAGLLLLSALSFQGCSLQGEAMRCEVNDDCESGLTCASKGIADKICCPPETARATTSECRNGGSSVASDTGIAETTPVTDTGTNETAADTATADSAKSETAADTGTAADTATTTDADAAD